MTGPGDILAVPVLWGLAIFVFCALYGDPR